MSKNNKRIFTLAEEKPTKAVIKMGLPITMGMIVVFSIVIMAVGLIFINPIVEMLGADESTFAFTKQYTGIMFFGTFFMMGNYTFGQLLRSEGAVMPSMLGMVAGTVANIVLDPIFIFGLNMGVRGAAIATVLGNAIAVCIFIFCYAKGKTMLKPSLKYIKPDAKIIKEILWVGFPHTLEQFMTTAATIVLNNLAASYGGLAVAAIGVTTKLMSFGSYIYQGMTAGCQPILGYCYGAGNNKRLKAVIKAGIKVTTLIEIAVMIFFVSLAPVIFYPKHL